MQHALRIQIQHLATERGLYNGVRGLLQAHYTENQLNVIEFEVKLTKYPNQKNPNARAQKNLRNALNPSWWCQGHRLCSPPCPSTMALRSEGEHWIWWRQRAQWKQREWARDERVRERDGQLGLILTRVWSHGLTVVNECVISPPMHVAWLVGQLCQ